MENDVYEEISIPDINYEERQQLLKKLDRREKDREELELEQMFESFRSKASNADEIESLASQSMIEMKEEKKINIYKPNFKKSNKVIDTPT